MPKSYKVTIPIRPKVKGRPRFSKKGYAYTPKNTRDYENAVKDHYKGPLFEGPISMSVVFTPKRAQVTITQLDGEESKLRGAGQRLGPDCQRAGVYSLNKMFGFIGGPGRRPTESLNRRLRPPTH